MDTGIVIPVWNLWENMTLPCLQALAKHTDMESVRVYLVDNASTDATVQSAGQTGISLFGKDRFVYLRNSENLGFAAACNQGARQAEKDGCGCVLFLNNDTVVTPGWLPPLIKALENPRVGMAGPLLLYPDGSVQHCGVVLTPFFNVRHIYENFPANHPVVRKKRKFRVITGAALLCRTEQFLAVGGFFEGYKNGMEDIDLCYTYAEQGFMQQVVPESVVYHHTSQTPGRLDKEAGQHNARLLFRRKAHMKPDAHLYYHNDGYIPALTKDFVFYVRLAEEKRNELNSLIHREYSDDLCRELLLKEPFWHDGYRILAESLVRQGKMQEAVYYCQKSVSYCFCRQNIKRYLHVSAMLADKSSVADVQAALAGQLEQLDVLRNENQQKLKRVLYGDQWYDRLLATQELDFGE